MSSVYSYLEKALYKASALITGRGLGTFLDSQLKALPPHARVLSVGAGGPMGRITETHKRERKLDIKTLDIDPSRGPEIVADIIDYDPAEKFDAVLMMEVLEHIVAPHAAAQNLHKILRPGGTLILSAPFLFPIHDRPHDYFRFTRYGLEELFKAFDEVEIKERDFFAENLCVLLSRIVIEESLSARIFKPFAVTLALVAYPFAMILSKLVKTDALTSGYVMVAKKNLP